MKKSILATFVFLLFSSVSCTRVSPFKMSVKPTITLFSNFKTGIADPNNKIGFNLERVYLGNILCIK